MRSTRTTFGINKNTRLAKLNRIYGPTCKPVIEHGTVEIDKNEKLLIPTKPITGDVYLIDFNDTKIKGASKHVTLFATFLAKKNKMRVFMRNNMVFIASSQPPAYVKATVHSVLDEYLMKLYEIYNFRKKYY